MNEEIFERYIQAGKAASTILRKGSDLIRPDASLAETADQVEQMIIDAGLGVAFPVNISLNESAAHDTPSPGDERTFNAGDMVKLDLGAHLDGYIADTAMTIDLGDQKQLVEASHAARDAAIALVRPGISIGELGTAVAYEIGSRGFRPIANLTGHGLDQFQLHMGPNVPNIGGVGGAVLEEGMAIAIEPFATTGTGYVSDLKRVEIYSQRLWRPVRMPASRKILSEIEPLQGLPFARRHLKTAKPDFALTRLVREGVLHAYPVLADIPGSYVSQSEHTMIVTSDGCIVTTA
ncbi:MAG: type II methionyl aminopeptidase [Methanospirillum sp.]|uniref:type II methionyl aminopeptidase n=1 Tax=Methanospirillum sp. TaxID=45200 RepID=UPI0023709789|nr:type II methionyl aminopeptidase [Methanospirillum sp.]MDD1728108.1 type II methionyl aminopeptidase [Methanospirillum sp.]